MAKNPPKKSKVVVSAALAASLTLSVPISTNVAYARTEPTSTPGLIYMGDDGTINDVSKYVQLTTHIDPTTRTITWDFIANQDHVRWSFGFSEYLFLPSGLDNSTIHIDRAYTDDDVNWVHQDPFTSSGSTASGTRYITNPADWDNRWQESVINGAANNDGSRAEYLNTLKGWRTNGLLGGPFVTSQEGETTAKFHWVVTAKYLETTDPYNLPIVFGIQSGPGRWMYYLAYGPFNSDSHNLTDVKEGYYGLDPFTVDTLNQYITPTFTDDQKLLVKNPNSLTDEERELAVATVREGVKRGIEASGRFTAEQKQHILDDLTVNVAQNGVATIVYPDFVENKTLQPNDYLKVRTDSFAPTVDTVRRTAEKITGTGVPGATIEVTLPDQSTKTTTVDDEGKWSVDLPNPNHLNVNDEISAVQTEPGLKPSAPASTAVQPSYADEITPNYPLVTTVEDTSALTDDEKKAVEEAVKAENTNFPEGTTITVGDDGTVTITYPDKSTDTISGDNTVVRREKSKTPTVDGVSSASSAITGTGVPGATITIDSTTHKPIQTQVREDGTWSVDAPAGFLRAGETIIVTQKEADRQKDSDPVYVGVLNPYADTITPNVPGTKTLVDNPAKLTDDEKKAVEDAVKTANPDFPQGTEVSVGNDGTATITYPDDTTDTISGDQLVVERPTSAAPTANAFDSDDTTLSGTGVPGASIEVTFPDGTKATTTVGEGGTWSVAAPESVKANDKVTVTQTEPNKKPNSITVNTAATTADTTDAVGLGDDKVLVDDITKLTDAEKQEVEDAIEDKNSFPNGTDVEVGDDGTVTVTYPDGSKDVIPGTENVALRPTSEAPTANAFDSDDTTLSGTGVPGAAIEVTFPDGTKATTTVGEDGTWSVNAPESVKADDEVTVTQTEPNKKPNTITVTTSATAAETNDPVGLGDDKVLVNDLDNLSDEEKDQVEEAIKEKNDLPDGSEVEVSDDGTVTITYLDGSKDVIPGDENVSLRPTSAEPTANAFDSDDTTLSGTGVPGATIDVVFPDDTKATTTVGEDGTWSVNAPESVQANDEITVTQTEPDKQPKSITVTAAATTADNTDATGLGDDKVVVDNKNNLTDEEKDQVEEAIKEKNDLPEGSEVEVGDDGTVTITYPDGSKDVIPGDENVVQRPDSADPKVNPVDSDDTAVTGTGVPGATIDVVFPDGTKVSTAVGEDGTWSVDLPSGMDLKADDIFTVTQTETGKKPATTEVRVLKTDAEKYLADHDGVIQVPGTKVPVGDTSNLTDDEKAQVIDAIRNANPDLPADATISVADDGSVTITFGDGSTLTIKGSDVVVAASKQGMSSVLAETSDTTTTGLFGAGLLGGLGALVLSVLRRKKDEE